MTIYNLHDRCIDYTPAFRPPPLFHPLHIMSSRSAFSAALRSNTPHHSVQGTQGGANDQTVATAKDGSDFASFLGPLPPFSGKQAARERFSRETFDLPDRYVDETEYLTGILDFFIIDKVRRVVCNTRAAHATTHKSRFTHTHTQAEFWCNTILPWRKTDSLNFQWNVWSKPIFYVLVLCARVYRIFSRLPLYIRCISVTQSSTAPSRTSSECGWLLSLFLSRTHAHTPFPFQTPPRCAASRYLEPLQPQLEPRQARARVHDRGTLLWSMLRARIHAHTLTPPPSLLFPQHGFYNTDQGRESFALNLKQITDAVHTTCYSDVLHSLLQSNAYYKDWNSKFGVFGRRQSDIYGQERRRWSIVSKSPRGLYVLDQDLKSEFRREGVTPTAWIWVSV